MKPSRGTVWPTEVRVHVATHQPWCLGPSLGMPGDCAGGSELDHVRVGGTGMKSQSVATNAARLCSVHHWLKTREGRTWRPRLLVVIAQFHAECARCQRESIELWGRELVA